jgi:hypothetical protein
MSKTKAALELGIEINSLQEYLEDDVLKEYYSNLNEYNTAVQYVKWAIEKHTTNGLLALGVTPEVMPYLTEQAAEFTSELDDDEHDYIEAAEMLLNYYRQAWNWDHEHVNRFNVRKKAELIAQQILNKAGL